MGIGDWGLGIGEWGLGAIPNPQSPIPNPQSPIPNPPKILLPRNLIEFLIIKIIFLIKMDKSIHNCSSKNHNDIKAISYCFECKINLCNKCENFHYQLFQDHQLYKIDENINEIFTGFCKEKNHLEKLKYYCLSHNKLCCASCITKLKGKGVGQHTDCEVFFVDDIKDEKKNKLKENIQCLEYLSKKLGETIDKLKSSYEEINKNKEELKLKIQKILTKIRNSLNEREDKLISEVDKEFDDLFFKEDILKNIEKLPNKIKIYLEKGKILDNDWKDENKLYSLINDSINIENNIKEIKNVFENAKKINNLNDINIDFFEEEYNIDKILEIINIFGNINHYNKNYQYKFKNWPKNRNESKIF